MLPSNHLDESEMLFKKALDHLKNEFSRLQVGRASPALVEHLSVEAYGTTQPLRSVASITTPDPKTIQIQAWDKGLLNAIERAIQMSDLHLPPTNDGVVVRINIPPLTEERRRELTKVVGRLAEDARISVRSVRQQMNTKFKEMENAKQVSEDERMIAEKKLQEKVDSYNKQIDELAKKKEQDVMQI
ncbi:ribosome recycling factor [Candidatus Peregrinibacteria bacterium]|nr:ribosome recycling factor [Candidatus Peregrinibacteria bacterium]